MISSDFIFSDSSNFEEKALRIFQIQSENNPVYKRFCEALGINNPSQLSEIPLLPIQAFKEAKVVSALDKSSIHNHQSKIQFRSSGTSGMERSRHFIQDPEVYRQSVIHGMQQFYNLDEYVIWAYTPGYNANPNSSLIWMLKSLIEREKSGMSKFLELGKPLAKKEIEAIHTSGRKLLLFGAAFGLLDLLDEHPVELPQNSVILETGGMKTHRREITKEALHQQLAQGFGLTKSQIHSEYGMTELLSQAYAQGSLWFKTVSWMKVSIRDPKNPDMEIQNGEEGLIGVIDLANIHSCSFILTGDKGVQKEDGKFRVLGRWNPQNLRGCNFLIDQD